MENENLIRIQRISGKFRLMFAVFLYAIPIVIFLYWLLFNYLHLPVDITTELSAVINRPLTFQTLLLGFLVSLIPASVAIYGVFNLKELFKLYEKGIIFSEQNVKYFRHLGYSLIYWVVANMVFVTLMSIVLTFNNQPGQRMAVARFDLPDIGILIIGAVVVLVSWVMNEASKLEDEQAHTV